MAIRKTIREASIDYVRRFSRIGSCSRGSYCHEAPKKPGAGRMTNRAARRRAKIAVRREAAEAT